MPDPDSNPTHITTTETVLRFYVFLGQYIDRCLDEEHRRALPEPEFQKHLSATHDQVAELLATNRVVKGKTEAEFQRVTGLCQDYLTHPGSQEHQRTLKAERETLRIKMLALSDLLAVFRSV